GRRAHDLRKLRFGADEKNVVATHDHVARELLRDLDLTERLLKVDDVNPVPLGEDEPAHFGIPAPRLVSKMDAGREKLFERGLHVWHVVRLPLIGWSSSAVSVRHHRKIGTSADSGEVRDVKR